MNDGNQETGITGGGLYVDRELAAQAVRFASPLLERMVGDAAIGQSGVLYVVILDPARPAGESPAKSGAENDAGSRFEDAILLEHWFGKSRDAWDADYGWYARAKARVSWRTGRASDEVRASAPWLLARGDVALGGAVVIDGIVVAVSGLDAAWDEAAAGTVALALRALIKLRARKAAG
jgi:hypothetical protein